MGQRNRGLSGVSLASPAVGPPPEPSEDSCWAAFRRLAAWPPPHLLSEPLFITPTALARLLAVSLARPHGESGFLSASLPPNRGAVPFYCLRRWTHCSFHEDPPTALHCPPAASTARPLCLTHIAERILLHVRPRPNDFCVCVARPLHETGDGKRHRKGQQRVLWGLAAMRRLQSAGTPGRAVGNACACVQGAL